MNNVGSATNKIGIANAAKLISLAMALLLAVSNRDACQMPGKSGGNEAGMPAEVQERVHQAVAAVGQILVCRLRDAPDRNLLPRGSAVVIRRDGIVVTSYHVVAEDRTDRLYDEIYFNLPADAGASPQTSRLYTLKAVLLNKSKDLALLRITPKDGTQDRSAISLPAIGIGDSRAIKLLENLIIIGFPEKGGSTITVNTGVVEGKDLLEGWIKTDARLIHGNSGGAAINSEGKLIGIPTKVLADRQPIDKDGDGFPDDYRWYGAVGFLRPAYLVESMLAQLGEMEAKASSNSTDKNKRPSQIEDSGQVTQSMQLLVVSGVIRSVVDRKPIAGARVGLTPLGVREVTANNLLTWGGTNGEGQFRLNKPVPPGRYTLKAKALNYEPFSLDVEIDQKTGQLIIELHPSP